jgi:coproporphyrinogen III oxidase
MIQPAIDIKSGFVAHICSLQDVICNALEEEDGGAAFIEDNWQRPGGGGGRTRIMEKGNVFEKAGVNTSEVHGAITTAMKEQLQIQGAYFFATGISLVLHPFNPFVPTVHANFRYFELYDENHAMTDSWFGGGLDLTPYYLFREDAIHFHRCLRESCDHLNSGSYSQFKENCDRYFTNKHRGAECRGIGGIFFDHLRAGNDAENNIHYRFVKKCSERFVEAYLPIVQRRKKTFFSDEHKYWQEIRRGRYVEFNLLHDRGTLFGLKTNGRTESILMSLPPTARFDYNYQPAPGSEEEKLLNACLHPVDWL